jgi:hypothetical protein
MKINIYGYSNLGIDLALEGEKLGHQIMVCSKSRQDILHDDPDLIINTRGGCAGGDFVDDPPRDLWRQNITTNVALCRTYPKAMVLAFSSNAAMEPWRTPYAGIKWTMEQIEEKNFRYIRVGNLYGKHIPELTFPGRLIKNQAKALPLNPIVPMPTDWLANRYFRGFLAQQLWPSGLTTVHAWGEDVLERDLQPLKMTEDRNQATWLEGSGPHWKELWLERRHWYGKSKMG